MPDYNLRTAVTSPLPTLPRQFLGMLLLASLALPGFATDLDTHFPPPLVGPIDPIDDTASKALPEPSFEHQVIELTNQERLDNGGLPPLKYHTSLGSAAETHSENMAVRDFFAHCDLDTKTSPGDRITTAGYSGAFISGENIAAGQSTPEGVMDSWMNSSGHRANILRVTYCEIGVGYYLQNNDQVNIRQDSNSDCNADGTYGFAFTRYWTQNFGCRSGVYPVVIDREAYATDTPSVQLYLYGDGWAQEMRIRNTGDSWPAWQTFSSNVNWQLSAGNGTKTVEVELRNGSTVRSASDSIVLAAEAGDPIFDDDFE